MTVTNNTLPTVTGIARQGQTLSSTTGSWTADNPLTYEYRWLRCDVAGANCVAIGGATNPTYTLTALDVGHDIRVEVTATEGAVAPPPPTVGFFGVPIAADGLANLEIGKFNRQVGHRFKAEHSGAITGVRAFLKQGSGYSAGDGGDIRLDLYAADGSGHPTGGSLANATISDPTTSQFQTFSMSPTLVAGTIYCLVWSNTSGGQATNYVSLNSANQPGGLSPRQPYAPNSEQGVFYRDGAGAWGDHDQRTGIMTIFYASGAKQGNGYIDYRSSSGLLSIGGPTQARMKITPSASIGLDDVFVWVKKSGSPSSLTITVKQGASVLGTASIPAASVGSGYGWETAALSSTVGLVAGTTYTIELSATSGTYNIFPYQSGEAQGFSGGLLFADGYYEYSTNGGSSWQTFSGSTAFDLPIYLT